MIPGGQGGFVIHDEGGDFDGRAGLILPEDACYVLVVDAMGRAIVRLSPEYDTPEARHQIYGLLIKSAAHIIKSEELSHGDGEE